jgi:hypothetical protein
LKREESSLKRQIRNSIAQKELNKSLNLTADSLPPGKKVNLPKLEIPYFEGSTDDFFDFWELFMSNIDANELLSDVDKLSYLKSYLKGEAKNVLHSLTLDGDNYKDAKDLVQAKYGSKEKRLESLIQQMSSFKACTSLKDTRNLQVKMEIIYI